MPKFWEKLQTHVNNAYKNKNKKKVHFHCVEGGLVRLSAKYCHVNPVEIPGILRFLPLVCSDFFFFLIVLASVMSPNSVRNLEAGRVE